MMNANNDEISVRQLFIVFSVAVAFPGKSLRALLSRESKSLLFIGSKSDISLATKSKTLSTLFLNRGLM
jgi:hypothetical protein